MLLACPSCATKLKLGTLPSGSMAKCPNCGTIMTIPQVGILEPPKSSIPKKPVPVANGVGLPTTNPTPVTSPPKASSTSKALRLSRQISGQAPIAVPERSNQTTLYVVGGILAILMLVFLGMLIMMYQGEGRGEIQTAEQSPGNTDLDQKESKKNQEKAGPFPGTEEKTNSEGDKSLAGESDSEKKKQVEIGQNEKPGIEEPSVGKQPKEHVPKTGNEKEEKKYVIPGVITPFPGFPEKKKEPETTQKQPENPRTGGNVIYFMGLKGKGKRFCIIADRSGSMNSGFQMMDTKTGQIKPARKAMDFLRDELLKTLRDMNDRSEFFIIFYDSLVDPMPGGKWMKGGKDVEKIIPWVNSIYPRGGTNPLPAFQQAFQLDPRPDVIFFMTDGLIPDGTATEVARLNRQGKPVVINTIQLGPLEDPTGGMIRMYEMMMKKQQGAPNPTMLQQLERIKKEVEPALRQQAVRIEQVKTIANQAEGSFNRVEVIPPAGGFPVQPQGGPNQGIPPGQGQPQFPPGQGQPQFPRNPPGLPPQNPGLNPQPPGRP